jgi:hypothetical protein
MKLKLKKIIVVFIFFDLLLGYTSISFAKKETEMNKKISAFFTQKQSINLVSSKKTDNTYNTMKIVLNESLSSYKFEEISISNNEVEMTMNFQKLELLEDLISKIEEGNNFEINSIVPFSDTQNITKYKIGLVAEK